MQLSNMGTKMSFLVYLKAMRAHLRLHYQLRPSRRATCNTLAVAVSKQISVCFSSSHLSAGRAGERPSWRAGGLAGWQGRRPTGASQVNLGSVQLA